MTINLKLMQSLQATAETKFSAWVAAGTFALQNHTGYVAALKANAAAESACLESRGFANAALIQLQSDPNTDPSWIVTVKKVLDRASYQVQTLANAKQAVLADLAAHVKLIFPPAETSKFGSDLGAAAAVDAKTKAANPNPNARKDPSKQDTTAPPVETPPEEPSTPSWGIWAGAAAAGALLLKILKVW